MLWRPVSGVFTEAGVAGAGDCFCACRGADLGEDVGHPIPDGLLGDEESTCDGGVVRAGAEQA